MKATIHQLWETETQIIAFDDSEFERPTSFSDLKKCDNVLLGDKIENTKMREVLIDDSIYLVEPIKRSHPYGGTMYMLEVL